MAQKISVQIALEGGKEVQQELKAIGLSGEQAFEQIDQAAKQVGGFRNLDPSAVTEKLRAMGVTGAESIDRIQQAVNRAGRFEDLGTGIASLETGFNKAGQAAQGATAAFGLTRREINGIRTALRQIDLGPLGSQLAALGRIGSAFKGPGIALAAIGVSLAAITKLTVDFAESISKTSDEAVKLGLSFEKFKGMQQEFAKLGVSGDAAADGFKKFQEELQKAAQADPGSNLALFGQSADAAKQQMDQFLERLRQMPDSAERTNLAISKLGETAGTQFVQGLRAAEGSMTADERKAYDLSQALRGLGTTVQNLGTVAAAPAVTATLNAIDEVLKRVNASLQTNPWGTFLQGASLLNPVNATLQGIGVTLAALTPQADTGGQAIARIGQGASLLNPVNAAVQAVIASLGLIPPAAQQAGNATAQAGQKGAQGLELIRDPLTGLVQGAGTLGQTATQAAEQAGQGFQVWNEQLGRAEPALQQSGQAAQTWQQAIVAAVRAAEQQVASFISTLGSITWDAISSAGVAAWNAITGAINTAIDAIRRLLGLQSQAGSGGKAGGKAGGGLIGGRGTGTSDSNLAWLSRGEFVINAASVRQFGAGFFAALNAGRIPRFANGGGFDIADAAPMPGAASNAQDIGQKINRIDQNINTVINMLNGIGGGLVSIAQALARLIQTVDKINETSTGTNQMTAAIWGVVLAINEKIDRAMSGKKAGGGLIGGRGSGTSDSNLAWLSRGEFVIRAAAVRQFGAGFFAALNAGMFPGFALGGLVPRAIPAFAGGGMSHVTIQFPGLPPVGGLRASSAVVEELQRSAALAQVRSGGRKPSRYS